ALPGRVCRPRRRHGGDPARRRTRRAERRDAPPPRAVRRPDGRGRPARLRLRCLPRGVPMSQVAIAGIGMVEFGRHAPEYSGRDMGVDAALRALADARLSWSDVDYAVGGSNVSGKPDTTVSSLGLTGIPFVNVRNGCATGTVALTTAAQAIRSGDAETVLVLGFDKHERGAFGAKPADYGHGDWYGQSGLMVT